MQRTLLRGILIFVGIISLLFFPKAVSQATELDLPTQYDWRDYGYDSPVRDQGNCNAGYAFATVDAVQAAIWKTDSISLDSLDFSENHAKECNWHALNHDAGLPNTCEGENFKMLTNLFTQQGLVLRTCDPYVDYDTACNTSCESQYHITEWQEFSSSYALASKELIKQKIMEHGPVYTQMDPRITGFENYSAANVITGISTDPNNWTHGVLIVGWDDNLTYSGGKGAWIVKNSYGAEWGDAGYFYIAYNSAGIGSSLSTVTGWEVSSSLYKLHFYDEAGHTSQMSISDTNFYSGSAMALFPIEPNEIPQAVEFWTNDAAIVSFEIYEQFNRTLPVNLLYQSAEINVAFSGYHQKKINDHMELPESSEIAVVLNVKNNSEFFPIVLDHLGPFSSDKTWYKNGEGIWQSLPANPDLNFDGTIRLRTLLIPAGLNHKIFLPIISTK